MIIPYYQREAGILARAVASIGRQRLPPDVRIRVVVVDDQSPHPAVDELRGVELPREVAVSIVGQVNGGPGAARNTGLDRVGPDVDYVFFLDSDDSWEPGHVAEALAAFDRGAGMYFADHRREDLYESYLDGCSFDASDVERMGEGLYCVRLGRSSLFLLQVVPSMSAVAFRWTRAADLRFFAHLRSAGEDQVFLLQLAVRSEPVWFSEAATVRCGRGVNIYFDSLSWDRPSCLGRLADRLRSFRLLAGIVSQDDRAAAAFVADKTATLERLVALVAARGVMKRLPGFAAKVQELARSQLGFWSWSPRRLVEVGLLKAAGRFNPGNE